MSPELEELRKLPLADKLRIVEQLWEDIGTSDEPFPLPNWVMNEAQRRAAQLEADPKTALTRKQVWKQVEQEDG